jgi:hypothetical protein
MINLNEIANFAFQLSPSLYKSSSLLISRHIPIFPQLEGSKPRDCFVREGRRLHQNKSGVGIFCPYPKIVGCYFDRTILGIVSTRLCRHPDLSPSQLYHFASPSAAGVGTRTSDNPRHPLFRMLSMALRVAADLRTSLAARLTSYWKATGERAKAEGLATQQFRGCRRRVIGFRLIDGDEVLVRQIYSADIESKIAGFHHAEGDLPKRPTPHQRSMIAWRLQLPRPLKFCPASLFA